MRNGLTSQRWHLTDATAASGRRSIRGGARACDPAASSSSRSTALLAYLVLPALWTHYEHQKGLANLPMVTRTAQGIPGDPINVGLIGDTSGRGLRDARRRLVSGRSGHAEIIDRDRRQRAARPSLQGRAGQQSLLSRPPRGSRLRKADRRQRRSPQSCALLEGAGPGRGEAPGLARRGDRRSQRRRQPLHRRHHPSHRRRYRRRARAARGRSRNRRHGRRRNIR